MTTVNSDTPFNLRRFTLDGEPVDVEDFILDNSDTIEQARTLRADIAELPRDFSMPFGGGAAPLRHLERVF